MNPKKIKICIYSFISIIIILSIIYITNYTPPCLLKKATGIICPGCGMGRAVKATLHGDIIKAWQFDPIKFSLIPILIIIFTKQLWRWVHNIPSRKMYENIICYIIFSIIFINTIILNIQKFS